MTDTCTVVVCSPLEVEHVDRIRAVDPRVRVLHDPALIPTPRYVADHKGVHPVLDDAGRARWRSMLAEADVAFDFDWLEPAAMLDHAPRLRWVQATSSGIGQFVTKTPFPTDGPVLTTAAGVHSVPLAEFAVAGLLHFVKEIPSLQRLRSTHVWERYTTRLLAGRRVLVVGLGHVGREVARKLRALDVEVVGAGRPGGATRLPGIGPVVGTDQLDTVLPGVDAVVLACPLTPETRHLLDARRFALLPQGAILVNIARGGVVEESAMLDALRTGQLGGAALDVFASEPLDATAGAAFADVPNLILTPHIAGVTQESNVRVSAVTARAVRRHLTER